MGRYSFDNPYNPCEIVVANKLYLYLIMFLSLIADSVEKRRILMGGNLFMSAPGTSNTNTSVPMRFAEYR